VGSTASLVAGAGEAAAAAVVPASGGVVVEVESDGGQALGGRSHALGSSACAAPSWDGTAAIAAQRQGAWDSNMAWIWEQHAVGGEEELLLVK
jgi:hypothetical protein